MLSAPRLTDAQRSALTRTLADQQAHFERYGPAESGGGTWYVSKPPGPTRPTMDKLVAQGLLVRRVSYGYATYAVTPAGREALG